MLSFVIHLILLACAGVALFVLWRKTLSSDPWINRLTAAGFLSRAFLGQALFWISYARLPIARSLQLGNGFWFFAEDAFSGYYPMAVGGVHRGLWAIINYPRGLASVSFVQTLSIAVLLFGEAVSVGVLLNLFCFLATNYLVVRWAAHYEGARIAARIAIAAISLSPALIIWSLQPLKETMFQFLVVALVAACAAWQRAWIAGDAPWRLVAIAAGMGTALYAAAGVRWYFAFIVLVVACAFALLVAFRSTSSRIIALASAVVLMIVLSRAFLFGSGPYVPTPIRRALSLSSAPSDAETLPLMMARDLELIRTGFEQSGGASQIGAWKGPTRHDRPTPPAPTAISRPKRAVAAQSHAMPIVQTPTPPAPIAISRPKRAVAAQSHATAIVQPQTRSARFAAGTAAVLIPHGIGQRIGLFQIGGGHSLWWFSDIDTLVFDLVCFLAVYWFIRSIRSASLRNPIFWFVAAVTFLIAVPLVYAVTNFGTLFRLREMIYLGLLLIPLSLATAPQKQITAANSK